MSNLGFHQAMRDAGIAVRTTAVGDRYVLEELRARRHSASAASSPGTSCCPTHATTGDGLLTALHLMARVAATGRSLAELASVMTSAPAGADQRPGGRQGGGGDVPPSRARSPRPRRELGETGRVLLRPSGTEPLVRVMVEAADDSHARALADRLAGVVAAV